MSMSFARQYSGRNIIVGGLFSADPKNNGMLTVITYCIEFLLNLLFDLVL